ncbi:MAG: glycosyltransferase [Actinomycetospora sp.]|nr:glycosyltransferase [Actinomycetospora sp.]
MRFLVLTARRIESRQSGYDLRVAHLCAQLPGEVHLVVAPLQPAGDARPGLPVEGVFDSVEELGPLRGERTAPRRHLRTSNSHFLETTRPVAFARACARLAEIVRERAITHVVVFGGDAAELAATLDGPPVLLDVCDSKTLTASRARTGGRRRARGVHRVRTLLDVARKRRTESRYTRTFDVVTAISDADARAVEGSGPGLVHTLPNGLDEAYLQPLRTAGTRRGVVFWGNQAFGPNREALRFFVEEVFRPRLRDAGVELCVVGADAPDWLVELAAEEPLITLTGYVEDLPAIVSRYPIMVNPMCTGSGLKNKVLEAFGLGLVVVSTPLGVEAVPQARDGRHLACADHGESFADTVLALLDDAPRRDRLRRAAHDLVQRHYRWDAVGEVWRRLLDATTPGDGITALAPAPRSRPATRESTRATADRLGVG